MTVQRNSFKQCCTHQEQYPYGMILLLLLLCIFVVVVKDDEVLGQISFLYITLYTIQMALQLKLYSKYQMCLSSITSYYSYIALWEF